MQAIEKRLSPFVGVFFASLDGRFGVLGKDGPTLGVNDRVLCIIVQRIACF